MVLVTVVGICFQKNIQHSTLRLQTRFLPPVQLFKESAPGGKDGQVGGEGVKGLEASRLVVAARLLLHQRGHLMVDLKLELVNCF